MGHNCFLYCYGGSLEIEGNSIGNRQAVLFEDGDSVDFISGTEGCKFLLLSGKPLHEPISWRGPIVMNTAEEIRHAFWELDAGTFIK